MKFISKISALYASLFLLTVVALADQVFSESEDVELKGTKKCLKVGTLVVCNNASVGGNFSVAGSSAVGVDLVVNGSETIANNLTVIGAISANSLVVTNSIVAGGFDIIGDETISGDLTVGRELTVNGGTTLTSLDVLDNIVFESDSAFPLNAVGSNETRGARMAWASFNYNGGFINKSNITSIITYNGSIYKIGFNTGFFTNPPTVFATTSSGNTASYATTSTVTAYGVFINTFDSSGTPLNQPFDIIAIGS